MFWRDYFSSDNKKLFWANNSSQAYKALIVILCFALGGVLLYHGLKPVVKNGCKLVLQSETQQMLSRQEQVVSVEAEPVKLGTSLKEIKSIGLLKANKEAIIKSEISGKIKEVLFTEGSEVSKGDVLIKFEDDGQRAEVERFEAEYALKQNEFNMNKTLYQQKAGSQKTYKEAEAGMKMAKAQLSNARFQLSRTVITTPFKGKIGILKTPAHPGNVIQPNTELVYLVDNSKIKVEFLIPAKYIEDIARGQAVEITLESFPNKVFSGAVEAIDSAIDTKNHSILVKAVISNEDGILQHGMLANVTLITGEKSNVIVISDDSLDREGQHEFVWVIDDKNRAYRRKVITGSKSENGVEIIAGLQEGDKLVTSGQLRLNDGTKVKILNEATPTVLPTSDKKSASDESSKSDKK
ncbi:MAG: efflux RND transporter periplasmic adaptor subunit [Alphaproteobacteria bacterium]|nr:efflux RND transporter periplasmic adaptor subunit [Alphaproteobacteria bacterium]